MTFDEIIRNIIDTYGVSEDDAIEIYAFRCFKQQYIERL